jgi:hypothetical protein
MAYCLSLQCSGCSSATTFSGDLPSHKYNLTVSYERKALELTGWFLSFFNQDSKILSCWWVPVGMWAKASISPFSKLRLGKKTGEAQTVLQSKIVHISTGTVVS